MKNELARHPAAAAMKELQQTFPVSLQVVIPHRSARLTKAALNHASTLADQLEVRVRLIDVRVVPYGVSLDEPMPNLKLLERRLRSLIHDPHLRVSAEVIYARDWEQGFRRALNPDSVVLLSIKRPFWATSEKRLAARLRKLGHRVVWVECD